MERASMAPSHSTNDELWLALDLDHTLIHACPATALSRRETSLLLRHHSPPPPPPLAIYHLPENHLLCKLRPFLRSFLRRASSMYRLCICTHASRRYATDVLSILDPKGKLFGGRVICREDLATSTQDLQRQDDDDDEDGQQQAAAAAASNAPGKSTPKKKKKKLDALNACRRQLPPPHPSRLLIVDDTPHAWSLPDYAPNIIAIHRYLFFSAASPPLHPAAAAPSSLLLSGRDESERGGALSNLLLLLTNIHRSFSLDPAHSDVRHLLLSNFASRRHFLGLLPFAASASAPLRPPQLCRILPLPLTHIGASANQSQVPTSGSAENEFGSYVIVTASAPAAPPPLERPKTTANGDATQTNSPITSDSAGNDALRSYVIVDAQDCKGADTDAKQMSSRKQGWFTIFLPCSSSSVICGP